MTSAVRKKAEIAIGLPVHNGARHLRQALDGLLAQTLTKFQALILDDGSTDSSDAIIREYVAKDRRLHHVRLKKRVGLIEAWRRSARLSAKMFRPAFFAWCSDHDWVAPDWLEHLYTAITHSRNTAMVHARTRLMDAEGKEIGEITEFLDTTGLPVVQRLDKAIFSIMGAGDAVYGLFRWRALQSCGIFHDEIMPDRLLVTEVNLHGDVTWVEKAVRVRRQTQILTTNVELVEKQLKTLFPDGYVKKNPYASHATFFLRRAQESAASGDPQADLSRLYLGFSHYQLSLHKYAEQLKRELPGTTRSADDWLTALVAQNIAAPRLMPAAWHEAAAVAWAETKKARDARIVEGEKQIHLLSKELEAASVARSKLESELAAAQTHLKEAHDRKAMLKDEVARVRVSLDAARTETSTLSEQLKATSMARSEADAELAGTRASLDTARADALALAEKLRAAVLARSKAEAELAGTRESLETASAETRALAENLRATALAQSEAEARLATERATLYAAQAETRALSEKLHATALARSEIHAELGSVRTQLTVTQEAKATLDAELVTARESLQTARTEIQALSKTLEVVSVARSKGESELARARAELADTQAAKAILAGKLAAAESSIKDLNQRRLDLEGSLASIRRDHHRIKKRYRRVRILGIVGLATLKVGDWLNAPPPNRKPPPLPRK